LKKKKNEDQGYKLTTVCTSKRLRKMRY